MLIILGSSINNNKNLSNRKFKYCIIIIIGIIGIYSG